MKLAGRLPKGDANGLATIDNILAAEPEMRHVAMVVLSTHKITTDIDSGDTEATMRIDRIERVLPGDAEVAEQLLRRALQKRSGQTTLPIEVEDDISAVFREALLEIEDDDPATDAKTDAKGKGDEPTLDDTTDDEEK